MSRTTLCVLTAAALAIVSISLMAARTQILGDEVKLPGGPGIWKITMLVHGKASADAKLWTATPLDLGQQHILRETTHSDELQQKPLEHHPDRRELAWTQSPGAVPGPFRIRYECFCTVQAENTSVKDRSHHVYAVPKTGEFLASEPGVDSDHAEIAALARQLTDGLERPEDQVEALFQHIDRQIADDPSVTGSSASALECLRHEGGDSAAKSRLLAALCRNRGIPTRLLTGLTLARGDEQNVHTWVEAWVGGHWLPMDPFHHHFGRVPRTFLVFAIGDQKLVRGKNIRTLEQAFLVERVLSANADAAPPGFAKRAFRAVSLHNLPQADQQLVEFLLLLPVAALVICTFRNAIGLHTFGTFAPALLGLAFRDLHHWVGVLVFVSVLLLGWLFRRGLNRFHLLQVPRTALMLTMVVSMIIAFVVISNRYHVPATRYISLFPMVILTGMIERFWTLEEEDGTRASFRTLFVTLVVSACVSIAVSRTFVTQHMLRYPETVGLTMAALLLLGRYTGYRLTELYRFRDFVREPLPEPARMIAGKGSFGSNRF